MSLAQLGRDNICDLKMSDERITLQRRSVKVDFNLTDFATFFAFENHVAREFQINEKAKFVITDFDRETVIDDAVYESLWSGEYWKRNPKANRLFLVLDDISSPLEGDVELEVSYQPHFNTITKTGDANFSKIPHAVAELIDNSIQATNSNSGARTVEVEVELGGRGASFLVVRDNGRGMNASGLKDFATYFLTQARSDENRGVSGPQGTSKSASAGSQANGSIAGTGGGGSGSTSASVNKGKTSASARRASSSCIGKRNKGKICSGFISKFGVGALQAGFYIGSSLRVVTKTATQPDVYEFVMDEVEFERRAKTNAEMFRDNITLRNAGKGKNGGPESEVHGPAKELMDRLRAEEWGKSHFTYIVLALRDQHVEWFASQEKGCLKRELASIYHYYLHPDHCPDGIHRCNFLRKPQDNNYIKIRYETPDEVISGDDGETFDEMENGAIGEGPVKIVYTQRSRSGQVAEQTLLADVKDDFESRLNTAQRDSFHFHMEILHPMQSPKLLPVTVRSNAGDPEDREVRRVPVTGVIHYYPYDGEKETRPRARVDEEDDESTTIETFWEGRLVPESHAAALSFFPSQKLKKKEREAVGTAWKRRIKGMLFFDWHFPISNNKLRLQFPEGDLHTALNATNVPPKHPAVIYPGSRGRQIEKDFRDWLIKCHETLDIEYRFDDKMPSASGARNEKWRKWRKMTFGKGGATFVCDSRVKLPFLKPNVYGVINYFITEVDEEEEDGRGHGRFSLSRWPEEVYGEEDSVLYPVTELDPNKSMISEEDWKKEMSTKKKQLPVRLDVRLRSDGRPFPKKLTIRTGKEKMTGVQIQIFDGFKKPVVQISQGKQLRVHSILEQPNEKTGTMETAVKFTAKAFTDKTLKYDKMYFFDPMNIKYPGEYRWTLAVTKEGVDGDDPENHILALQCHITVLPGNPTKLSLHRDDWDTRVALNSTCWLPGFSVKLRDSSRCLCPIRSYGAVTVTCVEAGAFDVVHASSRSSTHRLRDSSSEAPGPLEYDDHSWRLEEKQTGILSAEVYTTRTIAIEVTVEAIMQNDTHAADGRKIFKDTFDVTFEPGKPCELVLLDPPLESSDTPVATVESGGKLPMLSLGALDAWGNRTAPSQNEDWQVTLDIASPEMTDDDAEEPEFVTPVTEKVAGGVATFKNPVVTWKKPLRQGGNLAVVDATLSFGVGNGNRKEQKSAASAAFMIRVAPNRNPTEAVVCLGDNPWPSPSEAEKFAAFAEAEAGTGAAKAADSVGVRRSYQAGSEISGLRLKLFDQGGSEVKITRDTFEASNKKAVTCSWNAAWHWPAERADTDGEFDRLPDLKVPTQISLLNGGLHHASVVLHPKIMGEHSAVTLHATFAFAVHAGPVARWVAIRTDTGEMSDQAGPLVMTAGCTDPKACQASFAKAVKGFLPVDDFGNLVKNVQRAPEISIEGMPNVKLLPEHQCKLAKPTKPNGLYQFPRALNLVGPPCEGGHLVIRSPRTHGGDSGGGNGDTDDTRVLRLAVSLRAGPPARVLIRSPALGVKEFSNEIQATQLAGFKVNDLEVRVVDAVGNLATLPQKGVKITVVQRDSAGAAAGASSSRSKGSSGRAKDLSKRTSQDPSVEMPPFSLSMKLYQQAVEGVSTNRGVALVVRADGSELEGVEEARIEWTRQRTSEVTAVHIAALTEGLTEVFALEEPTPLPTLMGQRGRRVGMTRPTDGPLPILVVWLETDNDTPFTPPAESITLALTTAPTNGARTLTNLYEAPVAAPEDLGLPHALAFMPKGRGVVMEQNVGDHTITCSYVEMRGLPSQGPQADKNTGMVLRVGAGAPSKLVPFPEDANLFHSLSASNQTSNSANDEVAQHARQLVETTFRFMPSDTKGNMSGPINGPLRMRIANLEGVRVPPMEMPGLEMSDAEGYVYADPTATGVFLFEENWLRGGVGTREGDYRLVVDSAGDPELQPWSTVFHFETDEKRLNCIRDIKFRLKPLADKMDGFHSTLHAARQRGESALRQVQSCVDDLPQSLTANIDVDSQDYAACIDEAARLLTTFEDEQRDRQSHRARPIKFDQSLRMRPEDEARINPIGYIVELGYVEDEYMAKLLSQKGGSKMKAVYVDTKRQLDMVRRAGAGGFCRETVATFRVPEVNGQRRTSRPRNAAEIAEKRLPLPDVREKGFIDYLVNIIQLPDQYEELRDTLFSALYGSMVMFDTHDNAHEYQKKCKQRGKIGLPILVKEDGASLERNGYMPPTKDPETLNKLKTVFASMPATLTPEYAKTEQYIRKLKTLIVALQDLLSVEHDVLRIHRDHDSQGWSVSIAALQAELEGLASGAGGAGAAPRTPPPSGGRSGRRGSAGSSSRRGSTSSGNGSRKGKGRGRDVEADQTIRGWSSKRQRR
ncbi:unnamed protein product [Ascophyllum nodosum]